MIDPKYPFPTLAKLAAECSASWPAYRKAVKSTQDSERILKEVLSKASDANRLLDPDSSLVLCGSFARYEMASGSDCDWTLLINGVVSNQHASTARTISGAIEKADREEKGIKSPGRSGTFGNLAFSHDLVHRIGGGVDSNENLTRRILMLLESRPLSLSDADSSQEVWEAVLRAILLRYFEEEVHFSPERNKVPRFLLNDITRYWRTIGVDYAAKHRDQDGRNWALRNAKLRFSRKLLFAAGLALCFSCSLRPPTEPHEDGENTSAPFIKSAMNFASTPPLEYLAKFIVLSVVEKKKRVEVSKRIFGSYDAWLRILSDRNKRNALEKLTHAAAEKSDLFQNIREIGSDFATGLELLFFNRDRDRERDNIAKLSIEYAAF